MSSSNGPDVMMSAKMQLKVPVRHIGLSGRFSLVGLKNSLPRCASSLPSLRGKGKSSLFGLFSISHTQKLASTIWPFGSLGQGITMQWHFCFTAVFLFLYPPSITTVTRIMTSRLYLPCCEWGDMCRIALLVLALAKKQHHTKKDENHSFLQR